MPNNKKKSAYDTFPLQPETRHVLGRHSSVNVTVLLRRLQVKIGNIYLFKIIIKIKNMETSLKTGFAQIFSCCPKNLSCPNFGGAAAPLAPPARTPMVLLLLRVKKNIICYLEVCLIEVPLYNTEINVCS